MSKSPGTLYIISAPSGAGKTSLVTKIIENMDDIRVSISYTTRKPRAGEVEGKNYFFINEAKFHDLIGQATFLESAQVFGYYYGTAKHWVEQQLKLGIDVILEIDWQGAEQVRRLMPGAVGIFILPPSIQTLRERLEGRGQDDADVIEHRLKLARVELSHCLEFDYLVVNDDFTKALADLHAIMRSRRLKVVRAEQEYAPILENLL